MIILRVSVEAEQRKKLTYNGNTVTDVEKHCPRHDIALAILNFHNVITHLRTTQNWVH